LRRSQAAAETVSPQVQDRFNAAAARLSAAGFARDAVLYATAAEVALEYLELEVRPRLVAFMTARGVVEALAAVMTAGPAAMNGGGAAAEALRNALRSLRDVTLRRDDEAAGRFLARLVKDPDVGIE
jgi:hypothetical protein